MTKDSNDDHRPSDGFIDLDRTFQELSWYAGEKAADAIEKAWHVGKRLQWDDLVAAYRVVILSEGGSGKTEEIRDVAKRLRSQGKQAFFLRLENISSDFELAFEEGSLEEFEAWKAGTDEGWIFLDSIDEARLKSFNDFEQAIKKVGKKIEPACERAHVVVTGRTSAWRPMTDLKICTKSLPKAPIAEAVAKKEEFDFKDEGEEEATKTTDVKVRSPFKIVTLSDLDDQQIAKFVAAKGVTDTKAFLEEVERADASTYTSRPQDLQELAAFWNAHGRIGSRLELMRSSIARRLDESDKARAEAKPLTAERARIGAQLLAAAATLGKEPNIRVADGNENQTGFLARDVLKDWDEPSLSALLLRPVFTQAIYEAVRFHHRSVREYLTAEWLASLLKKHTLRRAIEALIFREKYGIEIVSPTVRPVLPWLAILDEKIRNRVRRVDPEILLEGGDPSSLPLELRREILSEVCDQIASGKERRSTQQRDAVQRFATPDLSSDVKALLEKHKTNDELRAFLLRMVWLGKMKDLLPDAVAIASEPSAARYTRITAFRAVNAIGSQSDLDGVRKKFASEGGKLSREWLAELIDGLPPAEAARDWLLKCLEKTTELERYTVDHLGEEVSRYAASLPIEQVGGLLEGLDKLLSQEPVTEKRHCAISERFGWLMPAAAKCAERLVLAKHADALKPFTLRVLNKLNAARGYQTHEVSQDALRFTEEISKWTELNRVLFWHDVEAARPRFKKTKERITQAWQAAIFGSFWTFDESDFDYMMTQIESKPELDDKLVALSVAFELYANQGKPRRLRERLKRTVEGSKELGDRLQSHFRPRKNPTSARYRAMNARFERRRVAQEERRTKNLEDSKKWLSDNLEKLRSDLALNPSSYTRAAEYLFDRTCEANKGSGRWTEYNWKVLVPDFGEGVATYYRDAALAFWRNNKPQLRSEGYPAGNTRNTTIFGLVGLEIESHEADGWLEKLTSEEVDLACRYASFELNGFPVWFPKLAEVHPAAVSSFLMQEVKFELATEKPDSDSHYMLSDIAWSGQWAWNQLGQPIFELLEAGEPKSPKNLDYLLAVLQGSDLPDDKIGELAEKKCAAGLPLENTAAWYAVWAGVQPDKAIAALASHLGGIADQEKQTTFAMHFITNLLGERHRQSSGARRAFATPEHLKTLYLVMHESIRREDDIERAGAGVYSPGLRDKAQESRNALFEVLLKISGKEAFIAIQEVVEKFPDRPWFARYAIEKAEREGDLEAWSAEAVREFNDNHERTPATHEQLADLAVLRFLDLKDELEDGDTSIAKTLRRIETETEMRAVLGKEFRDKASGRYSVVQEEELADAKKPDLRFHAAGIDNPVPVELKLADSTSWSGPKLFEHLKEQLQGDYLRDRRSTRGVFAVINRGKKTSWQTPEGKSVDFEGLVSALQEYWDGLAPNYPNVDAITVVGIDLTKRGT